MALVLVVIYIAFIGLGIPDAILGAAWPLIHKDLGANFYDAGVISIIVSVGTVVSSLFAPYLIQRLGTGKLVTVSIAMTAIACFGYGFASGFIIMVLWAIPMGLGAGAIDVALNNFAALHLKAKHTSWLHACWGIGATIGPSILGASIYFGGSWPLAYQINGGLLAVIVVLMVFSFPLWNRIEKKGSKFKGKEKPGTSIKDALKAPGMKFGFLTFFFYSALEISTSLWCGSYLVYRGFAPEKGALVVSLLFVSVVAGRVGNGFLSMKFSDSFLVRLGLFVVMLGCMLLFLPISWTVPIGVCVVGLGCAPIYPSLIHETPLRFGKELSGSAISIQMAGSYIGTILMPPLFGVIAGQLTVALWPSFLALYVFCLFICLRLLNLSTKKIPQ